MDAADVFNFPLWWLFPLVMIVLCFLMMRGRKCSMMCGFGSGDEISHRKDISDSTKDILDKRYARGEIDTEEYQMIEKNLLSNTNETGGYHENS
jgi:uncharacterized membrane protein